MRSRTGLVVLRGIEIRGRGDTQHVDPTAVGAHDAKQEAQRRKRAVAAAEKRVADLDTERAALEVRFTAADLYDDPAAVVELGRELDRMRAAIDEAMAAWEAATHDAEGNS